MKTNNTNIVDLLKDIKVGKVQLPDFQRGWVWDDEHIRKLIASITNFFPIGAVMFLECDSANIRFQYRMIEGAPSAEVQPEALILDGQQRLTAIYDAMFSQSPVKTRNERGKEIECLYYIDIQKALDPNIDRIDTIVSVPKEKLITSKFGKKIELDLRTPADEYRQKLFPLNLSFDGAEQVKWQTAYFEYHKNDPIIMAEYFKIHETIYRLSQYQLPIISLEKETPLDAICQVFENVNTGGVSLTVFELVTATFATSNFRLREDWDKRSQRYFSSEILNVVTNTDFLTACTLLTSYKKGGTVGYKRKDVLNLKLEDYRAHAENLTAGFVEAKKFLNEERIFSKEDLPYTTQLISLAVMLTLLSEKNLANASSVREKLQRWYWCGVFGELYSSNDKISVSDVIGVMEWIYDDSKVPKVLRESNFNPMRLSTLQTRNSAAYKGFMALILKNSARDFISGREMGFLKLYKDEHIDIHHIFPKAYCERMNYSKSKWNSIINKTPLFDKTNRAIG